LSEEYDLKKSEKGIGQLYPILKSKDGKTIDGFHREAANPNWKSVMLPEIDTEEKLLIARAAANWHRREVPKKEKAEWINGLAEIYQKQGYKILDKFPYTNEIKQKIADVTGLTERTVVTYLHAEYKQTETTPYISQPRIPASERIETQLGSEVVERFREQIKQEEKLSPKQKVKLEEERQRQKEERKRKREENKRLKEEKLQKLAEERAKNLKTEELLKDAEFRQQVIREISKPQIVKASESGKIVEEMVSEYAPAIEEAFSKIKKDTNLPEPERNRLVLNMLLKNLQQGLLFCPKCGQRMFECSHCHTSLEKLKEEAKL